MKRRDFLSKAILFYTSAIVSVELVSCSREEITITDGSSKDENWDYELNSYFMQKNSKVIYVLQRETTRHKSNYFSKNHVQTFYKNRNISANSVVKVIPKARKATDLSICGVILLRKNVKVPAELYKSIGTGIIYVEYKKSLQINQLEKSSNEITYITKHEFEKHRPNLNHLFI